MGIRNVSQISRYMAEVNKRHTANWPDQRFELRTPGLLEQCSYLWANEGLLLSSKVEEYIFTSFDLVCHFLIFRSRVEYLIPWLY